MASWSKLILIFLSAVTLAHCSRKESPEPSNKPKDIFETVWNDFDKTYPYFIHKQIDWDSVYEVYTSNINDSTTFSELFTMIGDMTLILKDIHVYFASSDNIIHYSKKANYLKK